MALPSFMKPKGSGSTAMSYDFDAMKEAGARRVRAMSPPKLGDNEEVLWSKNENGHLNTYIVGPKAGSASAPAPAKTPKPAPTTPTPGFGTSQSGFGTAPKAPAPSMTPGPGVADPTGGQLGFRSENVADVASDIMSRDSEIMQRAETRGRQTANRRGLINSSISAAAAQGEVLDAVLPIASQQATQNQQSRLAGQELGFKRDVAAEDIAQGNRRGAEQMVTSFQSMYQNTLANLNNNPDIGASERTKLAEAAKSTLDKQVRLVENLYAIDIAW